MAKCPKISKEFIISKSPEIIIRSGPHVGQGIFPLDTDSNLG